MKRQLDAIIFLTLSFCSILSGCTRHAERKSVLRGALSAEPPTLDPYLSDTGISVFILKQVQSTLFRLNEYMDIVPADAERFKWANRGHELEVTLRKGIRWSDGIEIRACHYRDALIHVLSPETAAPLADLLFEIRGASALKKGSLPTKKFTGVTCNDQSRRLTLKLHEPFSIKIFYALTFVISSPFRADRYALLKEKWLLGNAVLPAIASGPYLIKEWVNDRRVLLLSRSSMGELALSSDRVAKISRIELPVVKDPLSAFRLYESGDLDFLEEIPSTVLHTLGARKDLIRTVYPATYFVGFSLKANPVLKDPRVRRALAYSVGQDDVNKLLKGGEQEARSWIHPQLIPEVYRLRPSLKNIKLARQLLDEAGYKERVKFPRLKLQYNSGERHQMLMEWMIFKWKSELGISVELNPVEWKVHVAQLKADPPDLFRYAWTAAYPDPIFFLELFETQGAGNFGGWENPEFNSIVQKLKNTPMAQRDETFYRGIRRAEKILVDSDPAIIPIYHYTRNSLVRPYVKNLGWDLNGILPLKDVHF